MIPLFVGTCLLLAMVPGPGAMIILRQMMLHGRHLAVFTLVGNELSLILWGVASGAGFAVIIATSPPAFTTMQTLCAALLVLFGVQATQVGRCGNWRRCRSVVPRQRPVGCVPGGRADQHDQSEGRGLLAVVLAPVRTEWVPGLPYSSRPRGDLGSRRHAVVRCRHLACRQQRPDIGPTRRTACSHHLLGFGPDRSWGKRRVRRGVATTRAPSAADTPALPHGPHWQTSGW